MKTYSVKPDDIKRTTHIIDASDKILGRVASEIAVLLMGKNKPIFSRNADTGDCVTVINAARVQVTGKKAQQKFYYRHSNFPGGFKSISYEKLMQTHPERVIIYAVGGMLPHNHLHDKMMKRLKVYAGPGVGKTEAEGLAVKGGIKKAEIKKVPIKEPKEKRR